MGIQEKIITEVKNYYGVDIFLRSRKRSICTPRQVCMFLLNKMSDMSLVEIGDIFSMDHSTVVNSMKTILDLCDSDPEIKRQVSELETKLR